MVVEGCEGVGIIKHYVIRHSPNGSRAGVNIHIFPAFLQD
jgi:hypothetical protein